jgi:membrane protein DedA with SNARE-associated domain
MPDISVEQILLAFGYAGVFGAMIANGFFSFPSSQVLYIIAGYFISTGYFDWFWVLFVGAFGNTIGNVILYEVVRKHGLSYITKYRMFPEREVRKVQVAFNRQGAWFLFVAKLLPAIKVFAPIPAGIARMHRGLYMGIIFISSYLWAFIFLAIGFYFSKSSDLFGKYAIVLTIVAFVVMAVFYRYMNSEAVIREVEDDP